MMGIGSLVRVISVAAALMAAMTSGAILAAAVLVFGAPIPWGMVATITAGYASLTLVMYLLVARVFR